MKNPELEIKGTWSKNQSIYLRGINRAVNWSSNFETSMERVGTVYKQIRRRSKKTLRKSVNPEIAIFKPNRRIKQHYNGLRAANKDLDNKVSRLRTKAKRQRKKAKRIRLKDSMED